MDLGEVVVRRPGNTRLGLGAVAAMLALGLVGCCDDGGGSGGSGQGGDAGQGGDVAQDGVSIQCENETCSFCCNHGVCANDEDGCFAGGDEAGRAILKCDGSEDCESGDACCAGTPAASFAFVAECQTASACSQNPMPIFFCHDRGECAFGEECLPWEFATYVSTCQNTGP